MIMSIVRRPHRLLLPILVIAAGISSTAQAQATSAAPECRDSQGNAVPCTMQLLDKVASQQRARDPNAMRRALDEATRAGSAVQSDPFPDRKLLAPVSEDQLNASMAAGKAATEARLAEAAKAQAYARMSDTERLAWDWHEKKWLAIGGDLFRIVLTLVVVVAAIGAIVGIGTFIFELLTDDEKTDASAGASAPARRVGALSWFTPKRIIGLALLALVAALAYGLQGGTRLAIAHTAANPAADTGAKLRPTASATTPSATRASTVATGPSLREIMNGPDPVAVLRQEIDKGGDVYFADHGPLEEAPPPVASQAIARFVWWMEPEHKIFIDVYPNADAAEAVTANVRDIALRLGWSMRDGDLNMTAGTIREGQGASFPLYTLEQTERGARFADFGCTVRIAGTPVIVTASITGNERQRLIDEGSNMLGGMCVSDLTVAWRAMRVSGIGHA